MHADAETNVLNRNMETLKSSAGKCSNFIKPNSEQELLCCVTYLEVGEVEEPQFLR
jgi:hypothetical protein